MSSLREKYYFTHNNLNNLYIGLESLKGLKEKYNINFSNLKDYIFPNEKNFF